MVVRTETTEYAHLYPIQLPNNSKYLDVAMAFSKLLSVLPQTNIKDENRSADNFLKAQCNTIHNNCVEIAIERPIAEAVVELLAAIKSDLQKAHDNGFQEGTNILIRLNTNSLSLDDFDKKQEQVKS